MSVVGDAFGRGFATSDMLGSSLFGYIGGLYRYEENLYPRPVQGSIFTYHPITLLSAAPIRLATGDKADNVRTDFWVSN